VRWLDRICCCKLCEKCFFSYLLGTYCQYWSLRQETLNFLILILLPGLVAVYKGFSFIQGYEPKGH